jgi:hypothetical protein
LARERRWGGRAALLAFVGLAMTSLFADMTYEGARSVIGPYMGYLGAGLVVAGAISVGDLVSYLFRFIGGEAAQRLASPRAYWGLAFLGYAINLVAVPLLALTGRWWEAFALVIIERSGKGLRTAPRDAILAEVSSGIPRGLAFSLHEVADQVGAVAGALIVAAALKSHGYHWAFLLLGVPAGLALASLAAASMAYPRLEEARLAREAPERLPGEIVRVSITAGLGMAAFMHWAQASYRLASKGLSPASVAALYSIAMLCDALIALPAGALYDRRPTAGLSLAPALSVAATITALLAPAWGVAVAVLWGLAMGVYETAYRAAIAGAPVGLRGRAYAALYASMGAGWALGNLALALLPPKAGAMLALALGALGILTLLAPTGDEEPRGYYEACRILWGGRRLSRNPPIRRKPRCREDASTPLY